ncbi:MAG: murein biosynthesis integral membrane protein MurJ [Planctomycetota bacterium]
MPIVNDTSPPSAADARSRLARNSFLVGACTGLSRILGFARDTALGALLGSTPTHEALKLAFSIPNFLRRLFGEGALTAVFLPIFQREQTRAGGAGARETVSVVGGAQVFLLVFLALAGSGFCYFLPPSVLAQFLDKNPERAPLLLQYLTILVPYLVPVCLYAFAMAILNARGKFFIPAIAPFFQNVVALAAFFVAWGVAGDFKNPTLLTTEELDTAARIVAIGFLTGGVTMFLMQIPSLRAEGMWVRPKLKLTHPAFLEFAKNLLPMALSLGAVQLTVLLSSMVAFSVVAGGANVHLDYAARIFQLPQGIVGSAVATAAFPNLSKFWQEKRFHDVRTELDRGLGLAIFLGAAAAAGLLALAAPIVTVLFGYGKFDDVACAETSKALVAFSFSIPFLTAVPLLARIFYAAGNTRTPSYVAASLVIVDVGGALLLARPYGVAGIAGAATATSILNCMVLAYLLKGFPLPASPALFGHILKIVACAAACGIAAFATRFLFDNYIFAQPSRLLLAIEVAASIAAGAAALFGTAAALQLPEVQDLGAAIRRRRARH